MIVRHIGWKLLGLGVFAVGCAVVFLRLFGLAGGDLGIEDPYEVDIALPSAISLVDGSQVRIAGVAVGNVEGIANRGASAVVRISLEDEQAPIYRDATVRVRTKTLVGENYLDLKPGTSEAGEIPDGGTVPRENALTTTQFDEILSALDPTARRALKRSLDGLGPGLRGRGAELNSLLEATGASFELGKPVLTLLAEHRTQAARLVIDAATMAEAFSARTDDLRMLIRQIRTAATAVAARDQELSAALEELPGALRSARSGVGALATLADSATPVIEDLTAGAEALGPAMRRLGPAARQARRLLEALDRLTTVGVPLADELGGFASEARPMLTGLRAVLNQLDPALAYVAPYYREIGAVFGNLGSGGGSRDPIGQLGRVHALIDENTYAGFAGEQRTAIDALFKVGALSMLHLKGTNNYPAPGEIASPEQFEGKYPRLRAVGGGR